MSRPHSVFFFLEGLSFSFPLRDLSLCHPLSLLRFLFFHFFLLCIYIAILLGLIVIYSLFLILVD